MIGRNRNQDLGVNCCVYFELITLPFLCNCANLIRLTQFLWCEAVSLPCSESNSFLLRATNSIATVKHQMDARKVHLLIKSNNAIYKKKVNFDFFYIRIVQNSSFLTAALYIYLQNYPKARYNPITPYVFCDRK